jgi:hypothetical protein
MTVGCYKREFSCLAFSCSSLFFCDLSHHVMPSIKLWQSYKGLYQILALWEISFLYRLVCDILV